MVNALRKTGNVQQLRPHPQSGLRIGRICAIDALGRARVDYVGNTLGPLVARTCVSAANADAAVLLSFENEDPALPVIVGLVKDELVSPDGHHVLQAKVDDVLVDGKRITLEGKEEVVLRCGQCSITLTKEGRVVIKGIEIVSRASRTNKIKGGSVNIN